MFEAERRDEVFAALKQRGISAIRIDESEQGKNTKHRLRIQRMPPKVALWGLVAILVAVSALITVHYLLRVDDSAVETHKAKATRTKKAVTAHTSNSIETSQPENKPITKYKTIEEQYYAETNGLSKPMLAKWRFEHRQPAAWTNDSSKVEQPEYATFDFQSEKEIICLLTVEPGDTLLGDGNYGPEFERDFLKSLTQPIIVSKDDTPEQAEWKRMMIETKIDLKARMDAGESISDIMQATRREYQRMAEMKDLLTEEIAALKNSEGVTVQDMETCIEAANRMLESKGVSKLKISPVMRKALMRKCVDYKPDVSERN